MTFYNIATGQTLSECDFYTLVSETVYDCCSQSENVWIAQPNNLAFNEYQWQQWFIANPPECGPTFTPEYQAILDFATAQGITLPSAATQTAHDTFLASLKNAGLWGEFDMLNIYYGDMTQDFARINWVNPVVGALATLVNSPTYTNKRGFNSDGSTSYIDTEFDPSTGTNYTLNDACAGFFGYNNIATSRIVGSTDARISVTANNGTVSSLALNSTFFSGAQSSNAGLVAGVRTSSTNVAIYRNATSIASSNSLNSSVVPSHFHALSNGGGFAPNTFQIQSAFAGSSTLYADGGTAMSSAFNTLMSTSL